MPRGARAHPRHQGAGDRGGARRRRDDGGATRAFQAWAEKTLGDVGWTMLEFELIVLSRHDPELRDALTATLGVAREITVTLLKSFTDSLGVVLPVPAQDAASSILSLGVGLGIQRAIDPTISARVVTDNLRVLLAVSQPSEL